ncbi:MAG: hypothetical protein ACI9YH_000902 [Colwellia sp.]
MKKTKYYPFTKELFLITKKAELGESKEFINWLASIKSKFNVFQYERLLKLLKAASVPTNIDLLPHLIDSLINSYKSILRFSVEKNFKNKLEADLRILDLINIYLIEEGITKEKFDINRLLNPKKRFKLSYLLLTKLHRAVIEKERIQYVNIITFLLFQYQLTTDKQLYKGSTDSIIKIKSSGNFKGYNFERNQNNLKDVLVIVIAHFKNTDQKYNNEDTDFYNFLGYATNINKSSIDEQELTEFKSEKNSLESSVINPLSGSRLSLEERMLLPYRTNCLKQHEQIKLIDELTIDVQSKRSETKVKSLFTFLSLITSKPDNYLNNLIISLVPLEQVDFDYICIEKKCWYRHDVEISDSRKPTEAHKAFLNTHSNCVALTLPILLIQAAEDILGKQSLIIGRFRDLISYFSTNDDNKWFKEKVTKAAIRSTMFSIMAKTSDANFAALSLSNSEYVEPTHLYYLSLKHSDIQTQYYSALKSLNLKLGENKIVTEKPIFSGSRLPVNFDLINEKISLLIKRINKMIRQSGDDFKEIINCHNTLACYTVFVLIAVTGHRHRKIYSFSRFTICKNNILVSDKVDNKHSTIRILTLPDIVQHQIDSYLNHCKKVSKYLNESNKTLKKQLLLINSDSNSGACDISLINHKLELENIDNKHLAKFLSHNIDLPENFFRHALASFFRVKNKGKLAQEYLGHVRDGEHTLTEFSPISLKYNTNEKKEVLTSFIVALGFDLIKVDKEVGGFSKYDQVEKVYKPFKYKKLGVSNRTIYKWIMSEIGLNLHDVDLVKENIEIIVPAFIDINQKVFKQWEKSNEQKRAQHILERLLTNIKSDKKSIVRYMLNTGLNINNDLINNLKQSKLIKEEIQKILIGKADDKYKFFQLLLSIVVNTNRKLIFTPSLLTAIQNKWLHEGGMCWVTWSEKVAVNRLIVDSISVGLKNKLPFIQKVDITYHFESLKLKLERNIHINKELLAKLNTLDDLSAFLSLSFDNDIPANLRYYRSDLIDCSCLSDVAMLRLCFDNKLAIKNKSGHSLVSTKTNSSQKENLKNLSDDLLKDLRKELKVLSDKKGAKSKVQLTNTILSVWQRNIKSSSYELNDLINESESLTSSCCAILIWLIDVSKRPGKNRDTMGIGSLTTYLSNVAPSIMAVAQEDNIFEYNELSFLNLYIKSLSYMGVEKEKERKIALKDFHHSLTTRNFSVELNWSDVKEKEYVNHGNFNYNIITMSNYLSALKLLKEDKYSTKEEKRVNQLCLIFCYRLGLRWDCFDGIKTPDIDLKNMILSLKSNENRRFKSINGNRLIPMELFLSNDEKLLINEQIEYIDQIKIICKTDKFLTTKAYIDDQERVSLENAIVPRVIEALKIATNDKNSDLHDVRRSFSSYMALLLTYHEGHSYFTSQLSQWSRRKDVFQFSRDLRLELTGSYDCTNKVFPALALLMGHSWIGTTTKHYIHIFDLQLYSYNEKQLEQNYSIKFIAEKLGIRADLARKTLSRNGTPNSIFPGYQCLVNKATLEGEHFQKVARSNNPNEGMIELKEKVVKDSIFNDLINLHKSVQTLHEKFDMDEKLKDIVTTLKFKTKFEAVQYPIEKDEFFFGVNYDFKHRCNDSKNYINDKLFLQLCKTFDDSITKNTVDLFELSSSWLEHFHPKLNLVVKKGSIHLIKFLKSINRSDLNSSPNSIKCLSEFIEHCDLSMFIHSRTQQQEAKSVKYHKISNGFTDELYEQLDIRYRNKTKSIAKKFNYFMFLLTTYKMLNNYDNEKGLIRFNQRNQRNIF